MKTLLIANLAAICLMMDRPERGSGGGRSQPPAAAPPPVDPATPATPAEPPPFVPPAPADLSQRPDQPAPSEPLRDDGPTLEEYEAAGYKADTYPPAGFAARQSARYAEYTAAQGGRKPKLGDDVANPPTEAPVQDKPRDLTRLERARDVHAAAAEELAAAQAEHDAAIAEKSKPLPWDPAKPQILLEDGRVIDAPALLEEPASLRHRVRQFSQDGAIFHHVSEVKEAGGVRWVYRQDR
jgi:hypothetical protein